MLGCAGRQAGAGHAAAGAGRTSTGAGRARQQAWGARGSQARGAALARPGRAAGLWAVHLVHSTCF